MKWSVHGEGVAWCGLRWMVTGLVWVEVDGYWLGVG